MRVKLLIGVAIFLVLFALSVIALTVRIYQNKAKIVDQISRLPSLRLLNMDSTIFETKDLPEQKPLVIIFFNTTCEHCQQEAQLLSRGQDSLKAATVLWVSEENIADISTFAQQYHLPYKVLKAGSGYCYRQFGVNAIPTILIYDTQRKLVKQLKGASSIAAITQHL